MNEMKHMLREIENEVRLTRSLIGKDALDPRIMQAISQVQRHKFVPKSAQSMAYTNGPVSIGYAQTISQPYMVALMTDLLNPEPEHRVLEVGTGSGYQAAVLSMLVEQVYSLEVIPLLAEQASARLQDLGYRNVEVKAGDGYLGWPEHAPFDSIIVTAAAPSIPPPLIEQLAPGGRMVIPVGLPYQYQELMLLEKSPGNKVEIRTILGVAFVPLTRQSPAPEMAGHARIDLN